MTGRGRQVFQAMSSCLVLRFFALSDLQDFRVGMKAFLDKFMDKQQRASKHECVELENQYLLVLETATEIYGEYLFRLPGKSGKLEGRRSVPLADAVLLSIDACSQQMEKLIERKTYILEETQRLLGDKQYYREFVGYGLTKTVIEERIDIFNSLMQRSLT